MVGIGGADSGRVHLLPPRSRLPLRRRGTSGEPAERAALAGGAAGEAGSVLGIAQPAGAHGDDRGLACEQSRRADEAGPDRAGQTSPPRGSGGRAGRRPAACSHRRCA